MSRDLSSRTQYPAGVAEVFALRTSERWIALKAERLRDGSRLVERTERPDGGVDVAVSRELPSGVPGFLQKFLPKDGRVVQREQWGPPDATGRCTGTWSVEIPGAPAKLGGTSFVERSGDGSVQQIDGSVKVSVPIIGGKAEQFIADMTTKLMAKEASLMVASLSE
ncbi:MAG: DUF2505 domain-containing protein [Actinobacteria bacterium]|nr:DUF2505 domain-containing protein [Actinomycetota bacterium]MCA1721833.1 DUF2505 domain-containing protein [Actinomycetota bacterium]